MKRADWSVVATVAEPRRLVEAFVAHHLAVGAKHIFLFFDDPLDGQAVAFERVPDVTAVSCDAAYWNERRPRHGRPSGHRQRQTHNAEYAARKLCTTEWLANIDADEFLHPRASNSISDILMETSADIDAVRILPAEHIIFGQYSPGKLHLDGAFKLKPPNGAAWGTALYGEDIGKHFANGFQGHEIGKSFKRCSNHEARFNIHFVRKNGTNLPEHKVSQDRAVLLHAFPASFEDWRHKYERRVDDPEYFASMPTHAQNRYSLFSRRRADGGEQGIRTLFHQLSIMQKDDSLLSDHPDRFLEVDLALGGKVAALVQPYIKPQSFEHMSAPALNAVPEHQRIFQIGMNRSGSKEICAMAGCRNISYAHWDRGRLAKGLLEAKVAGKRPFEEYDRYQLLSDLSFASSGNDVYDGFYDVEYIFQHFPTSIYVLNYRPMDEWLASRGRFRGGKLLEEHRIALGLGTKTEVLERWERNWTQHVTKLRQLEEDGLRLIEYSLNTEKPAVFFEKLENLLAEANSDWESINHGA